jgi:hypothetical protein
MRMAFVKIDKEITIVKDGHTYVFPPGSVINPGKYPGIEKYLKPGYSDKMERGATK